MLWELSWGQRKNKQFQVIHYANKVLNESQSNYTTIEKELLAIVFGLEKFITYLIGFTITIFNNHATIKYLLIKSDFKPRLIRWILLLQEFDLVIKDKKGNENIAVDHLCRLTNSKIMCKEEEISEAFPDEKLLAIKEMPWFADMAKFKAVGVILREYQLHEMKEVKTFQQ